MTFGEKQASRSKAKPVFLFRFAVQEQVFTYTSALRPITLPTGPEGADEVYEPKPIHLPNDLVNTGTLERTSVEIKMAGDNPVSMLFHQFPPSDAVTAVVFQMHIDDEDAEYLAVFTGKIVSRRLEGQVASVVCEPASITMKRPGLRRRYQHGCPHVLYGAACRANKESFTVTATVTSVSGGTIGFGSGWNGSFAEGRFAYGLCEFTEGGVTVIRTILRVNETPNTLVLAARIPGLSPGKSVKLSLGCNHQLDGCAVFNNQPNFGGMPWIPTQNPIGMNNQFY